MLWTKKHFQQIFKHPISKYPVQLESEVEYKEI